MCFFSTHSLSSATTCTCKTCSIISLEAHKLDTSQTHCYLYAYIQIFITLRKPQLSLGLHSYPVILAVSTKVLVDVPYIQQFPTSCFENNKDNIGRPDICENLQNSSSYVTEAYCMRQQRQTKATHIASSGRMQLTIPASIST